MTKIKKNLFYNISYQMLILIVPFITTPYVSRVLLPNGVGSYSITTAIAKYFFLFSLLGMSTYGNRKIACVKETKEELSHTFWNLFYFQFVHSLLFLFLFILYIILLGYNKYGILIICQIPYVISSMLEISWYYYGTENFKFMVVRNSIIKILTAIFIFIFVKDYNDVWIYILINSVSIFLGQLCLWPHIIKNIKISKPSINIIRTHFKPNYILFISVISVSLYTLMDKVMINLLSTRVELGYYENSYKIMDICCSIVGAIGTVMLPRISSLVKNNNVKQIYSYIDKSMCYVMILAFGISFGIAGIANDFSILYFGKEFARSGSIIITISPTIFLYSWENIIKNQYILPNNKDNYFVISTIIAGIINIIINYILIPIYGAIGAAIATVIAHFVSTFYQSYKVKNKINFSKYIKSNLIFLVFGIIMFIICNLISKILNTSYITLIIEILTGFIIYSALCFTYLYIKKDELVFKYIKRE